VTPPHKQSSTVVAMVRAPSTFRQSDITRAIRAARAAGVENPRIEITKDGKLVIITAPEPEPAPEVVKWR
jgi:hypothetical protein